MHYDYKQTNYPEVILPNSAANGGKGKLALLNKVQASKLPLPERTTTARSHAGMGRRSHIDSPGRVWDTDGGYGSVKDSIEESTIG